jgi:copper chaperone CopZ
MSKHMTTDEIRELIKKTTGYNSRQVSVKAPHSMTYVKVTVRDPKVDIAKVKEAVQPHNTWRMDETDYCEGQSITVETSSEVDEAHAQPFIQTITDVVKEAIASGSEAFCKKLKEDVWFQMDDRDAWIVNTKTGFRSCACWAPSVRKMDKDSIVHLALRFGRA